MNSMPQTLETSALRYFDGLSKDELIKYYHLAHKEINERVSQCIQVETIETQNFDVIQEEIDQSIQNLTLSLIQYDLDKQNYLSKYKNIFEFAHFYDVNDTIYEQSVTLGHPFHPMTKTKLGLSTDEVICYAPEFRNSVKIIPLICEASNVETIGEYVLPENYTEQLRDIASKLEINHPAFVFVHEWQMNHYIKQHNSDLLINGVCIPIYQLAVEAHPLLSFRTLYVPEFNCVIKTAVNAQATSAVRNVSQASIQNGITLSKYVSEIYKEYDGCFIQQDKAGMSLCSAEHNNKISCMIRETIPRRENQDVLVCASLITKSFITDQPIIHEAIDLISDKQQISQEEAIKLFFTKYVKLLIEATYRLMLEHHISLEAHMQNSSVVLEDGMPVAIYIRDFGGVRLSNKEIDIDCSTGLYTESFEALLAVFTHAVLYNHLFQMIETLQISDKRALYQVIYKEIESINNNFKPKVNVLKAPVLKVKSLLKMRLYGDSYDYRYSSINNPLFSEVFQCGKK